MNPLKPMLGASHNENMPIQIYRKFHLLKLKIFTHKNSDIFHMSAQNIVCRYKNRLGEAVLMSTHNLSI